MRGNHTLRYTLFGAGFGLLFPLLATVLDSLLQGLSLTPAHFLQVQRGSPLHWVIDTAPLFLGLFASLAGRRQDQIEEINARLEEQVMERQQMVARLETMQVDLERQVSARTADLTRRKNQLEIAAQVAREAAGIHDLDQLLDQTARLISERFGFYHTGIFLVDRGGQFATLQAASSEGGQRMLARGHRLQVGEEGIVGYVAAAGEPRIALDVGADAVFFNNPDLPGTRSEMALPLIARGQVIGVLDVQSVEPNAFTQEDVEVLQILADQIALGIETANLIAENQASLEAMQRTYQQMTRQVWEKTIRKQPDLGYRYDNLGRLQQVEGAWSPQALQAAQTGLPVQVDDRTLAVPLKVRDQVIGVIHLCKPEHADDWHEDEISLVTTLADQTGLALDSAQLYTDSQRRAMRERLVSEITTRIRATNDPQEILLTAVNALQRALQAHHVRFKLDRTEITSGGGSAGNGHDHLETAQRPG